MTEHGVSATGGYDPHAPTIPGRSGRTRWLLLAAAILAVALPVIELRADGDPAAWLPEVTPAIFPSIMAMAMSPFGRSTRALPLDEFERDALARASVRANLVIVLGIAALFVWLALASRLGWPMPTQPRHWMALGIAATGIAASLPVLFAEWMIPLPPAGE
ncbi:hypothetical protein QLH51_10505 [Sphingomonas sp. 2R-10]|uniref:hypothetical protein n=1 Tax=Sphingomonas sp. 2R-10 TaxID=3045148 RepID=UPI000F7A16AC|nr:hypothetical protein [Sphingomonas sp. 2R-10]MDJ0277225.1 hypothetical protein [Sphingomonas sp. 2R-10]